MSLYRIKPVNNKSVVSSYEAYTKDQFGEIKNWTVYETYQQGQGFREMDDPVYSNVLEVTIDRNLGWGCELTNLCSVKFEFQGKFTDLETEEIKQNWNRGGSIWLIEDDDHDWKIEDDRITINGPFTVDIVDEDQYNVIVESNIPLYPKPQV